MTCKNILVKNCDWLNFWVSCSTRFCYFRLIIYKTKIMQTNCYCNYCSFSWNYWLKWDVWICFGNLEWARLADLISKLSTRSQLAKCSYFTVDKMLSPYMRKHRHYNIVETRWIPVVIKLVFIDKFYMTSLLKCCGFCMSEFHRLKHHLV